VAQVPRCPSRAEARRLRDPAELAPDVRRVQGVRRPRRRLGRDPATRLRASSRSSICRLRCSLRARTAAWGRASVRRDLAILVSPPCRAPSPGGKPRSTPPNPRACPATPEPVSHVVSRNCQASPETSHHKRPAAVPLVLVLAHCHLGGGVPHASRKFRLQRRLAR